MPDTTRQDRPGMSIAQSVQASPPRYRHAVPSFPIRPPVRAPCARGDACAGRGDIGAGSGAGCLDAAQPVGGSVGRRVRRCGFGRQHRTRARQRRPPAPCPAYPFRWCCARLATHGHGAGSLLDCPAFASRSGGGRHFAPRTDRGAQLQVLLIKHRRQPQPPASSGLGVRTGAVGAPGQDPQAQRCRTHAPAPRPPIAACRARSARSLR